MSNAVYELLEAARAIRSKLPGGDSGEENRQWNADLDALNDAIVAVEAEQSRFEEDMEAMRLEELNEQGREER